MARHRSRRSRRAVPTWFWLVGGAGALYLYSQPKPALAAGSPTEYWFDPSQSLLWYEFGGVTAAPQAGMRPASSYEIATFWPPVNHPEFVQFAAGAAGQTYM